MAKAVVFDAYLRNRVEGKVVGRSLKGITIEDVKGVRLYATFDRIISDEGSDEGLTGQIDTE